MTVQVTGAAQLVGFSSATRSWPKVHTAMLASPIDADAASSRARPAGRARSTAWSGSARPPPGTARATPMVIITAMAANNAQAVRH